MPDPATARPTSRSRALTVVPAHPPTNPAGRPPRRSLALLALIPLLHAAVYGFHQVRYRLSGDAPATAVRGAARPAADRPEVVPGSGGRALRYAGTASVTLPPDAREITLSGPGGEATVTGNDGDDTFIVQSGSWRIEGRGGENLVAYATEAGAHAIRPTATNAVTVTGPEGTQVLVNVAALRFARSKVVVDASTAAARIVRLYDAALQRAPDLGGGTHFRDALAKGQPLVALAEAILAAPEGRQRFAPTLSNEAFVDALYEKALRRPADPAGRAGWLRALRAGRSRAWVLAEASESQEHARWVDTHAVVALAVEQPL